MLEAANGSSTSSGNSSSVESSFAVGHTAWTTGGESEHGGVYTSAYGDQFGVPVVAAAAAAAAASNGLIMPANGSNNGYGDFFATTSAVAMAAAAKYSCAAAAASNYYAYPFGGGSGGGNSSNSCAVDVDYSHVHHATDVGMMVNGSVGSGGLVIGLQQQQPSSVQVGYYKNKKSF